LLRPDAKPSFFSSRLAVENRDTDVLQKGKLFLLCPNGNLAGQLLAANWGTAHRTWASGWWPGDGASPLSTANPRCTPSFRRLRETSRSLQTIALGDSVDSTTAWT
jgi:hypothetical protein